MVDGEKKNLRNVIDVIFICPIWSLKIDDVWVKRTGQWPTFIE